MSNENQLQFDTKIFIVEVLRLLNANVKSCLPSTALKCVLSWLKVFSPDMDGDQHQDGKACIRRPVANNVSRR